MRLKRKPLSLGIISLMFCVNGFAQDVNKTENLSEIYQIALKNSPGYQADYYTMSASKEDKKIALGALLPSLGLSTTASYNDVKASGQSGYYRAYTGSLSLGQVLFNANLYETYQAANETAAAASSTYDDQKQQFMLNVATAYFNVLQADDQVSFANANLKAVSSALSQAEDKFTVGVATDVDVKTAKANYYSAVAALKQSENARHAADYALFNYTGELSKNLAPLRQKLNYTAPDPDDVEKWVDIALTNNASLRTQHYSENAAQKSVNAAKGTYLPTVSLAANYSVSDYSGDEDDLALADISAGNARGGYIGLDFSWNIFNGGEDYATEKQAAFAYQAASFNTLQLQRTIRQNIETDYYNVLSYVKQIEAYQQSVIAARSAYEQYLARFNVGTATMTDVLNQLQKLYDSQTALAASKYQYIETVLQLKYDAGTLSTKDIDIFNSWLV
ncbi:MAG: TolC family outer membrane protein [Francisellaceae bacterium]